MSSDTKESHPVLVLDELKNEKDYRIAEEQVQIKDVHADQLLWKIKELEKDIEELEMRKQDSIDFYDRRIYSVQSQINYRTHLLEQHMKLENQNSGKKTSKLPNGVLRLTTRKKLTFGDDETLLKFSFDNNIPTRVVEKPDKKAIAQYIQVMGDKPDICYEEEKTSFSYQTTKNITEE